MHNSHLASLLKQIAEKEEINDFLIVLHGSFNQQVVTTSIKLIEEKCRELNYAPALVTRLKMVSVEILQNISKHEESSKELMPYFVIGSGIKGVSIFSGNIVTNTTKGIINDRLAIYNSLDSEQLKNFYRDSLKNTSVSDTGNAGIGLLDIVYRSNQQVKYNFHEYKDNLYYFGLNVNITNSSSKK